MLLIFDVQVVEYLLLLDLGNVGVVVLALETSFPGLDFRFLLLDQLDETLVLVNQVRVLCKEDFDFLFEFIHTLEFPGEEHDLLIEGMNFAFE